MNQSYYDRRTRKWAPTNYAQRKLNSEKVGAYTDFLIRQKNKKNIVTKGLRQVFLEEYQKNGYQLAKELINKNLGKEVYTDEILISWLGIEQPRKKIFEAYKKGRIEDAYKFADEINEKIGCLVIKKETVSSWIAEEIEKEKKKAKNSDRNENDDAR